MPRGKIEANAEIWRERVRRWKESGLTSTQFAAQEGIGRPQALSWWAYHLSRRTEAVAKETPPLKLVRVETTSSKRAGRVNGDDANAVLIECGRHRIAVRRGFDDETLRRVLAVMEGAR